MEKVYRLLQWLDSAQAVDYLEILTETPITIDSLFQLWRSDQCRAFVDCRNLSGKVVYTDEVIEGRGFGEIWKVGTIRLTDEFLFAVGHTEAACSVFVSPDAGQPEEEEWIETLCAFEFSKPRSILFKPADIEALAAKMNGEHERPGAAELEDLRQQLEQERAAREAAETELLKRRAEDGKRGLDNIRLLMHDHKEFAAMQERAEQAERMVAALDRQLTEQAERKRLNDKAFKEMAKQLREHHASQQPDAKPEAPTTGLTFPYATKELEAMRAAVAKYWEGYTTDKRQPTQKEIGIELGELLGLPRQASGDPARKAIALAAAIKPSDLPDA